VATYLRRFYFQNGSFPVGDLAPGSIMGTGPNANEVAFNYIIGGSMQARNFNFSEQTGIFQVMRDFDIHQEIAATSLPVTLITSAGDRVIRPAEAREVRQILLNNNRIHDELILTQCGHSPMVECPDKFNPAVAGYLGRLNYQPVIYPSMSDPVDMQEVKALKAADAVAW
jgi:pimeloyl-ACP methyl ester carboxylesterase